MSEYISVEIKIQIQLYQSTFSYSNDHICYINDFFGHWSYFKKPLEKTCKTKIREQMRIGGFFRILVIPCLTSGNITQVLSHFSYCQLHRIIQRAHLNFTLQALIRESTYRSKTLSCRYFSNILLGESFNFF